jgi:hypothetical protein
MQELVYRALMKTAVNCDYRRCTLPAILFQCRTGRLASGGNSAVLCSSEVMMVESTLKKSSTMEIGDY